MPEKPFVGICTETATLLDLYMVVNLLKQVYKYEKWI
jgi:hypothetical protein